MGVDKPLEDLVGDTEQRYRSITLWVSHGLCWFWDRDHKRSSPDLGNFESAQTGRKKLTYPGLQSSSGMEYKLGADGIRTRALPGFRCWRAAANSLCEKLSEIFIASGVVALQRSDTS